MRFSITLLGIYIAKAESVKTSRLIKNGIKMNNLDIRKLKNIHQGKRAFFIGNGPSLRISDLELLNDEITFGCNKIYLAFEQTDWRPTYYSITDRLSAKTNSKTISSIPSIKLLETLLNPR